MKTVKQAQREARQLYHLCLVNGQLDEGRTRNVVAKMLATGHASALAVASRFQRLIKRDWARHSAQIASAAALPPQVRADIEAGLTRMYGPGLITSFVEDPQLLGGVRVTAGSDVYDGSIKGGLETL